MSSEPVKKIDKENSDRKIRLIWLDDEEGEKIMNPTENALKRAFDLKCFNSPDELIEKLSDSETQADVLLLDIVFDVPPLDNLLMGKELPTLGLSILDLLRDGKVGEQWIKTPVVLLTASTRQDVVNRIDEIPNNDQFTKILRKPKPPSEIVKAVRTMASKNQTA
ncbi:MAG: hypothetical protein GY795_19240 [Desulfobacterales bacterium]|nr:hypothetical protein [Desulfobacterales bacterium]